MTDREAFDLLSRESKEIRSFPFHVYIVYFARIYVDFEGVSLPVDSYGFFASAYKDLQNADQPGELFATYRFSQGDRWKCFLLRVPGMYATEAIDLWVFDTTKDTWQKPLRIADAYGDAGYSIVVQAWIEDLDNDGYLDIVRRTIETNTDLESTNSPTTEGKTEAVFLWKQDQFKDFTKEYLPMINLNKYRFKDRLLTD